MIGSQYGEDEVIHKFFQGQHLGFLVDVGAADGIDNSNSFFLIQEGWSGILIEPDPEQFKELQAAYIDSKVVTCLQVACGKYQSVQTLYCGRQVSTLDTTWRDRCIDAHKINYKEVKTIVKPLRHILDELSVKKTFDFLSIDVEGLDAEVLESLDLNKYQPRLICIEAKHCDEYVANWGYKRYAETRGNVFYAK